MDIPFGQYGHFSRISPLESCDFEENLFEILAKKQQSCYKKPKHKPF